MCARLAHVTAPNSCAMSRGISPENRATAEGERGCAHLCSLESFSQRSRPGDFSAMRGAMDRRRCREVRLAARIRLWVDQRSGRYYVRAITRRRVALSLDVWLVGCE